MSHLLEKVYAAGDEQETEVDSWFEFYSFNTLSLSIYLISGSKVCVFNVFTKKFRLSLCRSLAHLLPPFWGKYECDAEVYYSGV